MEYRVLGPLEVLAQGQPLELGGVKQRALLAILLLRANEVVARDVLTDELWGGRPPSGAAHSLDVHVSRLRRALEAGDGERVLLTRQGGYVLRVAPSELDLRRFERLLEEGRASLAAEAPEEAAAKLRQALHLWRGPALGDLVYEPCAHVEAERLEELRLAALEERIEADLACGRHQALVGELETLVREHPLRERFHAQLMLALYRSGRQADALERYRRVRQAMVDELGLEPGRELQELERAILAQDPALDAPARPTRPARLAARARVGRGAMLIAGGGLVLLAAVIAAVAISSGGGSPIEVTPNSVAVIDTGTDRLTADVPVGVQPADISASGHGVWVANSGDASVSRINTRTRRVSATIAPRTAIDGMAAGEGAVWTSDTRRGLTARIDPILRRVDRSIRVGGTAPFNTDRTSPVVTGSGSVWVLTPVAVARIDPTRRRVEAHIAVGNQPSGIAAGEGGVWVTSGFDNTVTRIDPHTDSVVATNPVGRGASGIAAGENGVWVAETLDNAVARIDPETNSVTATIPVGTAPTGVAVGAGAVWVANGGDGTVSRIDPRNGRVSATIHVGESPQALTVADGALWVSVQAIPTSLREPAAGGESETARIALDTESTDPAITPASPISYATDALLLNYPDRPFPAGARLQPEVARAMPEVSDGGRTYTYRLRHGFRFSPPSNQPVTAVAFRRAIERALDRRTHSYASELVDDIVGLRAYQAGRTRHIAGVVARGDRLTIRLTAPSPSLPARLATPYFSAVPPDTPIDRAGVEGIASAGPYYATSADGDQSVVLKRNPNYGGDRPQRLNEIDLAGGSQAAGVKAVEEGRLDVLPLDPEVQGASHVEAQYGPDSEAASAGQQRYFLGPSLGVQYLALNARHGLFSSTRLRRAVNYAIDRRALARRPLPGSFGLPTDQYVPPAMRGFRDAAIYPLGGPNVARAKRLAGSHGGHAVMYTCNLPSCLANAQIVRENLRAIEVGVEIRQFPYDVLYRKLARPSEPWDIADVGWTADYADPSDSVNLLINPFRGGPPRSFNFGRFADPSFQRRLRGAAELSGARRYRAYARLDADLARDAAPFAAYANETNDYFFSARTGCQLVQPIYGIDLASLCVRR